MSLEFGNIYWIPPLKHSDPNIAGHWVVLLYANVSDKVIYYQSLNSRIYKIFPNFGSFTNEQCFNCSTNKMIKDYKRYKSNPWFYLDIDMVSFLNFNKYKFLKKETYICLKTIEKDNYFDFNEKVKSGTYRLAGKLLKHNKKCSLVSVRNSTKISPEGQNNIINFCLATI